MAAVRALALLCVGLGLVVARPAWAFHTVFHFQVDRFEADGNVFGPADGVPDLVDDFAALLVDAGGHAFYVRRFAAGRPVEEA